MKTLRLIFNIALHELQTISRHYIYLCCMVIFPLLTMVFFTSLMDDGLPTEMPVGVVDLDLGALFRKTRSTLSC